MASEPLVDVEDQYDGYDHEEEEELRAPIRDSSGKRLTSPSFCAFVAVALFVGVNYVMDISVDEDVTSLSKLAADQRLSQNDYSASWGRGVPSFAPEDTVRDSITEVDHVEMNLEAEAPEDMKADDVYAVLPTRAQPPIPFPPPDRPKPPQDFISKVFRHNWFSLMLMLALLEVILRDYLMEVTRKERRIAAGILIGLYSLVLFLSGETRVGGFERMLMYWVLQGISVCRSPVVLQQREDLYRY